MHPHSYRRQQWSINRKHFFLFRSDVIASIDIVQKFTTFAFGSGVSASPIQGMINYIEEVDVYMGQFELWLNNYLEMILGPREL